jgi:hypothetical protein
MSRWSDLFTAPPNTHDSGDSGDNGAVGHPTVTNVPIVTPPLATERDVSLEATVTNVPIVNAPATIAEGSEEIAEFAGDATEGSIVGSLTDSVPDYRARRESEPVTMGTLVTVADGEEGLPCPNPDRCAGCGELALGDGRFYEYEGGYRSHADPACLIAWNEKWHAAEGREYDAEFYRQHLNPGGIIDRSPKHPACPDAPVAQWPERIGRLDPGNPPADVPLNRWRQFLADARRLIDDGMVAQAAAAGWAAHDLFGCDNTKPFGRVDQMGLVWFVKGGRIVSMSMSAAVIETPTGAKQIYRRKGGALGRVPVWELPTMAG